MRIVRDLLDRVEPLFREGGRFRLFKPIYAAGAAILLSPLDRSGAAPHVRDPLDVKRYMSLVIIALLPCMAASVYFFGLRVLAMVLVSYAAGGAVEVLFAIVRKDDINSVTDRVPRRGCCSNKQVQVAHRIKARIANIYIEVMRGNRVPDLNFKVYYIIPVPDPVRDFDILLINPVRITGGKGQDNVKNE